jgi:hypothetical protein
LHSQTVEFFKDLLEIKEEVVLPVYTEVAIPLANVPMNDQSGGAVAAVVVKPNPMGDENIVDLLMKNAKDDSFSNIPDLTKPTHNDSFGDYKEDDHKVRAVLLDEDDADLKNTLGHLSKDIDIKDNPVNPFDENLLDDNVLENVKKQPDGYDFININDDLMNEVGNVDFDQFFNFDENDPEFIKQQK